MTIQIPSTEIGTEALKKHDSYYTWLCKQSGLEGPLARLFYETDFRWNEEISDDKNRALKAVELRQRYAEHLLLTGESEFVDTDERQKMDRIVKSILGTASVFEVLVSLATEINDMVNMEGEPDIQKYFGILMDNAGFDVYDEEDFDVDQDKVMRYWRTILDRWLDRNYLPDGEGGLFPLSLDDDGIFRGPDQRERSLWNQLQDWVVENLERLEN